MGVPVLPRLPMARSVYFKGSENDQVWGELLDRSWRLTPEGVAGGHQHGGFGARRPAGRHVPRRLRAGPSGAGPAGPGRECLGGGVAAAHDTGGAGFHHSGSGGGHGRGGDPPRGGPQSSGGRNASGSSTSLWRTRRSKRCACCVAWPPAAQLLVASAGIGDRYALTKRVRPMTRLDRNGSPRGRQRGRRHAADWPLGCDHRWPRHVAHRPSQAQADMGH